ncbi:MAG: hypothetical protein HYV62_08705 [Candidatus Rokubacteria bacterium]|nr:hypothetical protein [Candidatus Rokubacteria bacterium]
MPLLVLGVLVAAAGFGLAALVLTGQLAPGLLEPADRAQRAVGFVLAGFVVGGLLGAIGQWIMVAREKGRLHRP